MVETLKHIAEASYSIGRLFDKLHSVWWLFKHRNMTVDVEKRSTLSHKIHNPSEWDKDRYDGSGPGFGYNTMTLAEALESDADVCSTCFDERDLPIPSERIY